MGLKYDLGRILRFLRLHPEPYYYRTLFSGSLLFFFLLPIGHVLEGIQDFFQVPCGDVRLSVQIAVERGGGLEPCPSSQSPGPDPLALLHVFDLFSEVHHGILNQSPLYLRV